MRIVLLFNLFIQTLFCLGQNDCTPIDSNLCYTDGELIGSVFEIAKLWESEDLVRFSSTPTVMNIDHNCNSEVIISGNNLNELLIINSYTGLTISRITTPFYIGNPVSYVLGDVDQNGSIEIFLTVPTFIGNGADVANRIICYDLDGSIRWVSNEIYSQSPNNIFDSNPALADFNQDGVPEVYVRNKIFNSLTGVLLVDGGNNGIGGNISTSIAVDINKSSDDLELIAGYTIYDITIVNLDGVAGNSIVPNNISVNGDLLDGHTGIADLNDDGRLEVIVVSQNSNSPSIIYCYGFNESNLEVFAVDTISVIDNDNVSLTAIDKIAPNESIQIFVTKSQNLLSYTFDDLSNLDLNWSLSTTDETGLSGLTIFDLNNDGSKELIYRDEEFLKIINVIDNFPVIISEISCSSRTTYENPIVASLDSTQQAKICVTCEDEDGNGRLTVFGAPPDADPWAPARGIWNQYNYHVLNINDDGTVPQFQENNATYQNGRYNNFMVQASLLDEDGNQQVPAAQLTGDISCIDLDAETDTYTITFDLHNLDDASLTAEAGMSVSFYDGDPTVDGNLLGTYITFQSIGNDESLTGLQFSFAAVDLTQMFMAVNTASTSPLEDESYDILECDYADNVVQEIALPTISQEMGTICNGSTYDFYGEMLSVAGSYYYDIDNVLGCDSVIVELMLIEDCDDGCEEIDTSLCYVEEEFDGGELQATKLWESEHETEETFTPLVMDIDGDCVPEVLSISESLLQIVISNSNNGSIKSTVEIHGGFEMVVADLNKNGSFEIIVRIIDSPLIEPEYRGRLISYNLDSSINWISSEKYIEDILTRSSESLGLADFNKDGVPEVYLLNEIYNALTGVKLLDGGDNGIGFNTPFGKSIAAELDDDNSSLELASGYSIYLIDITNITGQAGNTMIPYNISIDGLFHDGPTIVADVDGNNILDVIVSANRSAFDPGVYAYSFNNGTPEIVARTEYLEVGGSFLTAAVAVFNDLERDTFFMASAVSDSLMLRYYNNGYLESAWSLPLADLEASRGIVAFDLDSDGMNEIICGDEENLLIVTKIRSSNPVVIKFPCRSGTGNEKPIIASIDSTKEARICVTCRNEQGDKRLTVFGPPEGSHWAPARGIWNQYNYHVLNINDDGTIPQFQENNATYQNGRYNNFMVQASLLDEDGNQQVPAAQLTGDISCIDFDAETDTYTVTFDLHNLDDASLTAEAGMSVSFYDGDPTVDGNLLGTYITSQSIGNDESLTGLQFSFAAVDLTQIFMAVNTASTSPLEEEDYDILECDYGDNVVQEIALPMLIESNETICQGDTIEFYDASISDAGVYYQSIENVEGCDSLIATLNLSVRDTILIETQITICDSLIFESDTLYDSGIYTYSSLSANGCDSITQLDLTVLAATFSTENITVCDSLMWNDSTYTSSGLYSYTTTNAVGCDSTAVLDLDISNSDQITIVDNSCEDVLWNGITYTESGIYSDTTTNQNGCDSITLLDLTINDIIMTTEVLSGCDSLLWNGTLYTETGQYIFDTVSVQDCDSVVTLDLTIIEVVVSDTMAVVCDSFEWRGATYFLSGEYPYDEQSILGCDSTTLLSLEILQSTASTEVVAQCDSLEWNETTYTASGAYTYEVTNAAGCDSIITLDLTILQTDSIVENIIVCDSLLWNGTVYNESGQYSFDTINVNGCDSITTIELVVQPVYEQSIDTSLCVGDSILIADIWYYEESLVTVPLLSNEGCDSLIQYTISVNEYEYSFDTIQFCEGDTLLIDGISYTENTSFTDTLAAENCAEIRTTAILSIPATFVSVSDTIIYNGEEYNLILDIDPTQYDIQWSTPAGEGNTISISPISDLLISVQVTDLLTGCSATSSFTIIVEERIPQLYIPNIFSPNGDGNNDNWKVDMTDFPTNESYLYDRWGNLIKSWNNVTEIEWDGTFHSKPVAQGVYVYMIRYGDDEIRVGDVTVVR